MVKFGRFLLSFLTKMHEKCIDYPFLGGRIRSSHSIFVVPSRSVVVVAKRIAVAKRSAVAKRGAEDISQY